MEYKYCVNYYKNGRKHESLIIAEKGTRYSTMFGAYQESENQRISCGYDFFTFTEIKKYEKFKTKNIVNVCGWNDSFPSIKSEYKDAKILIVGTIPSDGGIKKGIYYGSERNGLWEMLDELYSGNDFRRKISLGNNCEVEKSLKDIGFVFRDVLICCERPEKDAKDCNIISSIHTKKEEFEELFKKHKNLNIVLCNSEEAFFRFLVILGIDFWGKTLKQQEKDKCVADYCYNDRNIKIIRVLTPSGIYYNFHKNDVLNNWKNSLKL
jgi:hypothetical protein